MSFFEGRWFPYLVGINGWKGFYISWLGALVGWWLLIFYSAYSPRFYSWIQYSSLGSIFSYVGSNQIAAFTINGYPITIPYEKIFYAKCVSRVFQFSNPYMGRYLERSKLPLVWWKFQCHPVAFIIIMRYILMVNMIHVSICQICYEWLTNTTIIKAFVPSIWNPLGMAYLIKYTVIENLSGFWYRNGQ